MLKLFLLALLCLLSTQKLYQGASLFRHGARYHLGDKLDGNTTREFWGEITKVGMRQHQTLGATLRKQYIDNLQFLSPTFKKGEIEAHSTSINRTIQSCMSQLYGLYPPGSGPRLIYTEKKYHLPPFSNNTDLQQQNYAFPYAHQPIHVDSDHKDIIFLENCPKLGALSSEMYRNHATQASEMNLTYYPFVQKVIKTFNLTSNTTFEDVYSLFGNLAVDKYLGRPLPSGFSEDDYKNMEHIHTWVMSIRYGDLVSQLKSTNLLKKVISDFDQRIKNVHGYGNKWSFLSAHDTDVLPTFIALNFTSSECQEEQYRKGKTTALNCVPSVNFASSIIFELHSDNERDFTVKIRAQGEYMNLCEEQKKECDYGQFRRRVVRNFVQDPKKVCGATDKMPLDFEEQFEYKTD